MKFKHPHKSIHLAPSQYSSSTSIKRNDASRTVAETQLIDPVVSRSRWSTLGLALSLSHSTWFVIVVVVVKLRRWLVIARERS